MSEVSPVGLTLFTSDIRHPTSDIAQDQRLFASILSRARQPGPSTADDVRAAAQDFVATALVQPVLKQLRESNQAAEPFKPNAAERSFRTMLDNALAARITRSSNWPLVQRVVDQFQARAGQPRQ